MCTVSWLISDDGYSLLSSRDEKRSRLAAFPPSIRMSKRVRYAAPMDADFGGTWIAANEYGLSLCLLNGEAGPIGILSRGYVIQGLIHARNVDEASVLINASALIPFAPFVLLALSGEAGAIFRWNGTSVSRKPVNETRGFLTSSSFDDACVRAARTQAFVGTQELADFHRSHIGGANAHSVCMHREDASTVSLTRIQAGAYGATMYYQPGAPCEQRPEIPISLPGV